MKENWRTKVDLGVVHYVSYPELVHGTGDMEGTLQEVLKDEFFSAVEISWIKDSGQQKRVKKMLDYAGMKVVYAGGPPYGLNGINLGAMDDSERANSLSKAKKLIGDAYAFGAKLHVITAGNDPQAAEREQAREFLVESLCKLSCFAREKAGDYLLTLSLEPIDRNVHRFGLIGPTEEACDVVRRVRDQGEYLGLTLDQSHISQLGENPAKAVATAADYIIHAHLANCLLDDLHSPLYGDEHPRFGAPGTRHGIREMENYLLELERIGFFDRDVPYGKRPIVSIEVKPHGEEQPDIILAASKRVVREAWQALSN